MKRMVFALAMFLALTFTYAVARSLADNTATGAKASGGTMLTGKTVKTPEGDNLGIISEVVAGPEGRSVFAIVSYQVSDDTRMRVPVPLASLSCDGDCVFNGNRKLLNTAPNLVSEEDLARRKPAKEVYKHFGLQPYWTAEDGAKE